MSIQVMVWRVVLTEALGSLLYGSSFVWVIRRVFLYSMNEEYNRELCVTDLMVINQPVKSRTQVERYGTVTVLNYCSEDYEIVRLICGRKIAVFSSFSVRKHPVNDAVLIDLGSDSDREFVMYEVERDIGCDENPLEW